MFEKLENQKASLEKYFRSFETKEKRMTHRIPEKAHERKKPPAFHWISKAISNCEVQPYKGSSSGRKETRNVPDIRVPMISLG